MRRNICGSKRVFILVAAYKHKAERVDWSGLKCDREHINCKFLNIYCKNSLT